MSQFGFLATQTDVTEIQKWVPIPALWELWDQLIRLEGGNPGAGAWVSYLIAALSANILFVFSALLMRLVTVGIKPKESDQPLEPGDGGLRQIMNKAKALDKGWGWEFPYPLIIKIALPIATAIIAIVAILYGMSLHLNMEILKNNIILGAFSVITSILLTVTPIKFFICCRQPDSQARSCYNRAEAELNKREKERARQKKLQERQAKLENAIQLFLAGKYEETRAAIKNFSLANNGDLAAIRVLINQKNGETIQGLRKSFDALWKAKDLGFYNSDIRKAVDFALETITPTIVEQAMPDTLKIYQAFLDGHYATVINYCEPHVDYGYPDAIALSLVAKIQSNNNPRYYPQWLEQIKLAKRRGLSEVTAEISEEIITKLEAAIQYNDALEEERKAQAAKSSPFEPSFYMPGPLSQWAEPSGWTDFRTGEPLYRVDGRIVNANGEEVSAAWWD